MTTLCETKERTTPSQGNVRQENKNRIQNSSDNQSSDAAGLRNADEQLDLLLPSEIEERFLAWKATKGGAQLLRFAYQETARFAARFQRTGQRVSMDHIMHILRDRIGSIKTRLAKSGITLPKEGGYRVNDHFTAHIARHIMARRTEWDGLFEKRKLGAKRMVARRKVTVVEYATQTLTETGMGMNGKGIKPTGKPVHHSPAEHSPAAGYLPRCHQRSHG